MNGVPKNLHPEMKTIWDYLRVEDALEKADAIFVMGGSTLEPVHKGGKLYLEGWAPYVGFISVGGTFGGQDIWGMSDSAKYEYELLEMGLPPRVLIKDNLTSNTLDEARKAIPYLESKVEKINSLIVVTRPFHQRRTWATFKKQHPGVKYINIPGDEEFKNDDATALRLVQEIERLDKYARKGDIETQDIPEEVRFACVHLKNYLVKKGSYQE